MTISYTSKKPAQEALTWYKYNLPLADSEKFQTTAINPKGPIVNQKDITCATCEAGTKMDFNEYQSMIKKSVHEDRSPILSPGMALFQDIREQDNDVLVSMLSEVFETPEQNLTPEQHGQAEDQALKKAAKQPH